MTFSAIDVTGYTGVTISFDYYTDDLESADNLGYEIWEDGVKVVDLVNLNDNTDAWTNVNYAVPDAVNSVYLVLKAKQDGGSDYAGFDNVDISGTPPCTGPSAQASFTSITAINSTDYTVNFGAGTGGNGRIVVVSDAAVTATPTSGSSYTANSVYGSGTDIGTNEFVAYDGAGTSVTITGLTANTTYHVAIFEYATGTSNDPCYDDSYGGNTGNATTTCGITEPATNASAYVISEVGCNGFKLSWTSPAPNAGSLVVLKASSDVTTDPSDGTTYTASNTFGSGTDIGTGEYVIYDGNGTSIWVEGLAASTTYHVNIFEYNGSGACIDYRTSDEVTDNEPTIACTNCPSMTTALINSCDYGACTEGDNEIMFLNSRDYVVSTADSDITFNYGSSSPAPTAYGDSFTTNTTSTSDMNADAGCTGVFIDAKTVSHIPPNAAFLIVNSSICADAFDWSSICSAVSGNVYVLYSDDVTWSSTGQFSNSPPAGGRFFRTILGGCTVDYSYDDDLEAGDGATASWGPAAGAATKYGSNGCALPASVLPISLLDFFGSKEYDKNLLKWSTSSEINNDYFTIEKSSDAREFESIGTIRGAGNSTENNHYNFIDYNPNKINYYRLKQTDFDGKSSYSKTIIIRRENDFPNIWNNQSSLHIELPGTNQQYQLEIINSTGQSVYKRLISNIQDLNTDQFSKGIHLIKLSSKGKSFVKKVIF